MKLTRKATNETVQLEDGFLWDDRFNWSPMVQTIEFALDGTPIIQGGKKKGGRPITLLSKTEDQGWIEESILESLRTWSTAQKPDGTPEEFTLDFEYAHYKNSFNVLFYHEKQAFEANPVKGFPTVSEDEPYNVTLRFVEVGS
ncbi:hypothetical protein [Acinetobacter sp. ANC 4640]